MRTVVAWMQELLAMFRKGCHIECAQRDHIEEARPANDVPCPQCYYASSQFHVEEKDRYNIECDEMAIDVSISFYHEGVGAEDV
mmetsp:Transcript_38392/g.69355  ORF Transcript_38392/g.69355 Transcript_38392/m.69355 type:complete len:84 (-) Transcript_38392:260-511(-)